MAEITFFYNPMSRAQIARWALHEVGADYEPVFVDWANKPQALMDANPMGKLPTIIHHHGGHDHVVTEAAAICHYLALVYTSCHLSPREHEAADYFRWLFFAAGPLEQAVTNKAMGWEPTAKQEGTLGFGSFDRTIDTLSGWFEGRDFVCGERFTMADIYVGSAVDWGLAFGTIPRSPPLEAYQARCQAREAYQAAKAIDMKLIEEAQARG